MMKTFKKGFTLAEVLTTLMVIGVVAAMTVPTLMNSTDDAQKKAAYKKAMSVLGQGAQLMVAQEKECEVSDSAELATCMKAVIAGTTIKDGEEQGGNSTIIQTADGMAYQFLFKGEAKDYKRSLRDICGTAKLFVNKEDYWSGKKALCAVVVDVNGTGKGTRFFNTHADLAEDADLPEGIFEGSDQFPLMLTGDGVRPIYVDGGDPQLNAGYEYMYGEDAKPEFDVEDEEPEGGGAGA